MILKQIVDLVDICYLKGVNDVIISPGSRSAAITIAFARHPHIKTKVVPDERSAAFIALGIAQVTGNTTVLVCTSGTAVANYYPAVIEAFFQKIPLLILTADRPPEWINQLDGQTIYQNNIFGNHIKESYLFSSSGEDSNSIFYGNRLINEAINKASSKPCGPVHINIPIREPFYPEADEKYIFENNPRIIRSVPAKMTMKAEDKVYFASELFKSKKVMIGVGQRQFSENESNILSKISNKLFIPVVSDVISNFNDEHAINSQDLFLQNITDQIPDTLITFGDSFISKNFKIFLRENNIINHWHFTQISEIQDPFLSITAHVQSDPFDFLEFILEEVGQHKNETFINSASRVNYFNAWKKADQIAKKLIRSTNFLDNVWNEFWACRKMLQFLPDHSILHLANSLSVRYANFIGLDYKKYIQVFANRGTSGIDGCLSSAVGNAIGSTKKVFLLIGDIAFFYDKNGLWHHSLPQNLKIILLNNSGGSIFRMIDGPSRQPELEDFFETQHNQTAENLAKDFGVNYYSCHSFESFNLAFEGFIKDEQIAIFEIKSDPLTNQTVFAEMKSIMKATVFFDE